MSNKAQKFIECLRDAEQLLKYYSVSGFPYLDKSWNCELPEHFNPALIQQWTDIPELVPETNPRIRIIQHLSCTGGTLICKCLAALPNVSLLSEVNPINRLARRPNLSFAPTDIAFLALQGMLPFSDELSEKLFKAGISVVLEHTQQLGKFLVIREHSHSDFMVGKTPRKNSVTKAFLKDEHQILSVLTVRHPVDSYLSTVNQDWLHFTPKTFNEYCRRYLLFIEANKDSQIYKYEDFVNEPEKELQLICGVLELPYNEDFHHLFDLFSFSGDSGRSGNIIEKRKRRECDKRFRESVAKSSRYRNLCDVLNYEASMD